MNNSKNLHKALIFNAFKKHRTNETIETVVGDSGAAHVVFEGLIVLYAQDGWGERGQDVMQRAQDAGWRLHNRAETGAPPAYVLVLETAAVAQAQLDDLQRVCRQAGGAATGVVEGDNFLVVYRNLPWRRPDVIIDYVQRYGWLLAASL